MSKGLLDKFDGALFSRKNWFEVLVVFQLTHAFRTVGFQSIRREDCNPGYSGYFGDYPDVRREAGDPNAGWFAFNGANRFTPIKASEAANFFAKRSCAAKEIQAYYDEMWEKLRQMEGNPDLLAPPPGPEEDTSIVLELDFLGSVNPTADIEDAINEALEYEGVDFDCMGSDGWSGDQSDSTLLLAGIRRGLKKVLPKEERGLVQIIKRGPGQDQVKTFGLEPTPRKRPPAD